ncbi:MAG: TonB-dependent receptor [Myxococcota bacterium]
MPPSLAHALDEVVVEEVRGPDPIETSASVTVLPLGADLPPGQDVASVVESASGTSVRRLGGLGDFSAVSLRGSTFRQVEVFLDGVPLNPDGASVVDLSELPPSAFSRLELYRGNAPAAFGSSAMGGVVNLVTPERASVPTSIGASGGSWGTARTWAVAGRAAGPVDAFLALDQLHTEGAWPYFDDQGTDYNRFDDRTPVRENNAVDRVSAIGRVRFGPDAFRVRVLDAFVYGDHGLAGPIYATASRARFGVVRNLLVAEAEAPSGRWAFTPRAWGLVRAEEFDDRGSEIGVGPDWSRDTYSTAGGQIEARWAPRPWLLGSGLVRVRRDGYAPYDLLTEQADGVRARLGYTAAASARVCLWGERVVLTPVVQLEVLDNRLLGEVPFEDVPVAPEGEDLAAYVLPRGGVLVRPLDWLALKANAGSYLRPPDFTELFGDSGLVIGNTDLVPEHGFAYDAGLRAEGELAGFATASVDAAYAERYATDLVVFVQNSQYTQVATNVGRAWVRTTELALDVDLLGVLASQTNVTFTLSRNLDPDPAYANNELPRTPPTELTQRTALRWRERIEVAHTYSFTSATWTDATNIFLTAPRSLHGVSLRAKPAPRFPAIGAEVLNLFDVRGMAVDRNPLSDDDDTLVVKPLTDFSGYPLPGRTVMVSVSWDDSPQKE